MKRKDFIEIMDKAIGDLWDGVDCDEYGEKEAFSCHCVSDYCEAIADAYREIFSPKAHSGYWDVWFKRCEGMSSEIQALRHFHLLSFKEMMLASGLYKEIKE